MEITEESFVEGDQIMKMAVTGVEEQEFEDDAIESGSEVTFKRKGGKMLESNNNAIVEDSDSNDSGSEYDSMNKDVPIPELNSSREEETDQAWQNSVKNKARNEKLIQQSNEAGISGRKEEIIGKAITRWSELLQ